ncbi:hypothetical protein HPB49_007600 [Dermacentor silvarum]|uniref:Uncharacterized protein n=1 Tax=Dermacentor silvarum TaxID=543639 RepID=A0ACB8CDQ6_DERSI|nr:hypothetical protein HPB49_007600 [Dermacentor silvarum]
MATEMLQAAWTSVSASTIANCFRHALCEVATCDCTSAKSDGIVVTDENMAEVEASWNALGDVGVVSADDFFYDYVNSDADAVPMEEPTDDAIVADVTRQTDPSDDEDAVVSHAHTFDVPTLPQALDAVDLVRRFTASTVTAKTAQHCGHR